MNISKKIIMASMAVLALSVSSLAFARCQSCAEKMAIKQSIKDSIAAALAATKPSGKKDQEIDTLEEVQADQAKEHCCDSCADGGTCESKRCGCKDDKTSRADREGYVALDGDMQGVECRLETLIHTSAACCKAIQERLKKQSHKAEKCCRQLKNKVDDVQDSVEDVQDLVISLIDAPSSCSLTETLILSQIDQSAACCSVTETLLLSQIDQLSDCCSSFNSRMDILEFQLSLNDALIINTLVSIFNCTCL